MLEVGPGFRTEPGQAVTPGKVQAKGDVFIRERSFKNVESDGKPYSDKMDDIMGQSLLAKCQRMGVTFRTLEHRSSDGSDAERLPPSPDTWPLTFDTRAAS